MTEIEHFESHINEINYEIAQLDPIADKLAISNLKAQRKKYQKYIEVLKAD